MKRILTVALVLAWVGLGHAADYVQKNNALIPGLYQIKTGQKIKGYTLAFLETGTIAGGIYGQFFTDVEGKRKAYNRLPAGLPEAEYGRAYDRWKDAEKLRDKAKVFLISAGAIYLLNLLDVALYDQEKASATMVLLRPGFRIQVAYHFN